MPAAAQENRLTLTAEQQTAMGLQLATAEKIAQFPSATYPALAMFPLKTIRTLSTTLSGTISQLYVVHGPISKGELLAEIESAELLGLQSELLGSLASLKVAKTELRRARQMRQSGVGSVKMLQQAQSVMNKLSALKVQQVQSLRLAGMTPDALQKLESTQQIQSETLKIISPIDGLLFDLQVRLGERVAVNQALFSLGETDPMILVVRVPVAVANRLEEGQMAKVDALPDLGVIEHIDSSVDAMTQSVDVHVKFSNAEHKIKPGQLFQLHFLMKTMEVTGGGQPALYQLPSSAISQFEGETVVFIQVNNAIQPLRIEVMNITQQTLYFTAKQVPTEVLSVFIKGSTAIKSAFVAG
jgi:biotin carboxyl carrier protein